MQYPRHEQGEKYFIGKYQFSNTWFLYRVKDNKKFALTQSAVMKLGLSRGTLLKLDAIKYFETESGRKININKFLKHLNHDGVIDADSYGVWGLILSSIVPLIVIYCFQNY